MPAVTVRAHKAGEPYGRARVTATLTDGASLPVVGVVDGVIVAPLTVIADGSGVAVLQLVANADIVPANTCYTIAVGDEALLIQVDADGGYVEDLLVTDPADLDPLYGLGDLSDVSIGGASDGDALVLSGGAWVPGTPGAAWTEVTQAEYDALSPPTPGVLYVVVG